MANTFYFNTGVKPYGYSNPPMSLSKGQVWRRGTKQIPFDADAPADATLLYLCNTPDLIESTCPGVIVREVSNTTICNKYAYFRLRTPITPALKNDMASQ